MVPKQLKRGQVRTNTLVAITSFGGHFCTRFHDHAHEIRHTYVPWDLSKGLITMNSKDWCKVGLEFLTIKKGGTLRLSENGYNIFHEGLTPAFEF